MAEEDTSATDGKDAEAGAGNDDTNEQSATTTTGTDGDSEANATGGDWRSPITDEKTRKYAEQFASPADAAKTAFEFRQKLSNAITLPGKKATPEETAEFRKKIGVPDSPEGYKFATPENMEIPDDDPEVASFAKKAHEAGLDPQQAQMVLDHYFEVGSSNKAAFEKTIKEATDQGNAALDKEWGADADRNSEIGIRAMQTFGGDEFKKFLSENMAGGVKLEDHPALKRVFANIGRKMGESTIDLTLSDTENTTLQDKRRELTEKIGEAHAAGDDATAQRLDNERKIISGKLFGTDPH